jgi:hypothetical protein
MEKKRISFLLWSPLFFFFEKKKSTNQESKEPFYYYYNIFFKATMIPFLVYAQT